VAKYKKKRARELQQDRFRDTAMTLMDRLGDKLEGKGKAVVYGIVGVILLALLVGVWLRWSHKKSDEARRAIGRAITISAAPITPTASTDPSNPTFTSERERAQRAIEEFQKVAVKYGDPYRSEAQYFIGTNQLLLDRNQGMATLSELTRNSSPEVAALSRFALAQAKEADGSLEEAAQIYRELASKSGTVITPETANLRLAIVYDKQGKKKEASDLLFNIIDGSRKAKDAEGNPMLESAASREASKQLQRIDAARYAQLNPEFPSADLSF
jgi:predicted negative regulator of RcsB-dependent stress response